MATALKILFPPVINTFMPAFVRNTPCKVYFSLPVYNSIEDIKNVQVSINNQKNNISAFNNTLYPNGIKISNIYLDNGRPGADKYYVIIDPRELDGEIFALNQYYKVQLRFTSKFADDPPEDNKIAPWLANNKTYFSEWSKVCLIRGIDRPEIEIKGLSEDVGNKDIVITTQTLEFIGRLNYSLGSQESEHLKSYRIKVYNKNDLTKPIMDSGDIYTNSFSPNEISYVFDEEVIDGYSYVAYFSYVTNNAYTETIPYRFSVVLYGIDKMNVDISATPNEEEGTIAVNIKSTTGEKFTGNITIRRTSSKSNFLKWEDVYTGSIVTGEVLDFTWLDKSVESGVWYYYGVQRRNARGDRGIITKTSDPSICYFGDMFLTEKDKQIKIKFNPQVTSFKININEAKVDTLGGIYPIIRRNGNTKYRQFPISGLISCYQDEDNIFFNPEEAFKDSLELYENFKEERDIKKSKDFLYERAFREKVMDFLTNSKAKLFRSISEGNILVKLMDVNFSPNQTLGRMLYSFSATAYEIAEDSLQNYRKFDVQDVGDYEHSISVTNSVIGQVTKSFNSKNDKDFIQELQDKYGQRSRSNFILTVRNLSWFRIQFSGAPSTLKVDGTGRWSVYTPTSKDNVSELKTTSGYLLEINGVQIIVDPKDGFYEIAKDMVEINSVKIETGNTNINATIDYIANIEERESRQGLASRFYYYHKPGQLRDSFEPGVYQISILLNKYGYDYPSYYQKFVSLNSMTIWAEPGTVVYIKDALSKEYNRFVIGFDGVLEFSQPDSVIEDFYFNGINFHSAGDKKIIGPHEFVEDELIYNSFESIRNLTDNCIYNIQNADTGGFIKRYIYYNRDFIEMNTSNNDVKIPVDAFIDYNCDVMRGEY